jgi:DNA-binding transcriptional LysR family regulator
MDRMAAMETFVRVVDAGSFSSAAKQLRVGQPAISKTIAQLEKRLGVRLLLRSTHGLKPTEAGRNFYQRARRAIEAADEAELAARGAAASLSGRLRICAPVTFARLHVMPRLDLFLAEHPALEVDVLLSEANKDLIGEGIDVALRLGQLADSSFTARRIGQSRRRVIGSPSYFEAMGIPKTPADLAKHRAVVYDQPAGGTTWTFPAGNQRNVGHPRGPGSSQRCGGCSGGRICRIGSRDRLRMDVRAGVEVRRGESRTGRLAVAAARSMGRFSWTTAHHQGASLRQLHRETDIGYGAVGEAKARSRDCTRCYIAGRESLSCVQVNPRTRSMLSLP